MKGFAEKMKQARIQKRLTQEVLADLSQLSLRTIQRIETGVNVPTAKTLGLICKVLEIEERDFCEISSDFSNVKILNIKLVLPYNWGHFRRIGIYADDGKLITKIMHGETLAVEIDKNVQKIIIKLDIFRSEIYAPVNEKILFLSVYMNFRDYFPFQYIDTLKRKCLTGKFVSETEFEQFDWSFYENAQQWVLISKINRPNLRLGLFLSLSLLIVSIIEQKNEFQELLFLVSLVSFISLLMIFNEKEKLQVFDYKSRMIATGIAFLLASLFLNSPFYIVFVFLMLSMVFLLKSLRTDE